MNEYGYASFCLSPALLVVADQRNVVLERRHRHAAAARDPAEQRRAVRLRVHLRRRVPREAMVPRHLEKGLAVWMARGGFLSAR